MRIKFPFFAPLDDKAAGAVADKPIGIKPEKYDDDTALLDNLLDGKDKDIIEVDDKENDDDEEADNKKEKESDDDEGLIEPELEIDTNARAIDLTKIKEKYPDFAKTNEFRELRNAYHREAQYTELFPTLEDAKEAAENNETFIKINDDLINKGDTSSLLNSIKEANPESFKKVTTTFLDVISKMDNALYVEVISPVVRRLAKQIYNEGQKYLKRNAESDDAKALIATANNILHYAFPDEDIDPNKEEPRANNEPSEKEKDLEKRETAIKQEKFDSAYQVAANSVEHNLDKQILAGLDPEGKFNEFTRDSLLEKIKNDVKGQINKDQLHLKKMNSLWKRSEAEGYNRESLSRIVAAYLERARPIIPTVRNKFRSIAIKGKAADDGDDNKNLRVVNRGRSGRAPINDGRVNVKAVDSKKIDYKNTTDDDIFEGKIKLKA